MKGNIYTADRRRSARRVTHPSESASDATRVETWRGGGGVRGGGGERFSRAYPLSALQPKTFPSSSLNRRQQRSSSNNGLIVRFVYAIKTAGRINVRVRWAKLFSNPGFAALFPLAFADPDADLGKNS